MRESFLAAMRACYPGPHGVHPEQLRELVRVFYLGWVRSLEVVVAGEPYGRAAGMLTDALLRYRDVTHPDWRPGDEWRWWLTNGRKG